MRSVSVVVPVFNSATTLDELERRIRAALDAATDLAEWELILVNDGSTDGSWGRIAELSAARGNVRGLDLTRNWGQHNALLAGIHAARFEVIVTIDDDLQNPPEDIPLLLAALGPGVDLIYGKPIAKRHAPYRRVLTKIARTLIFAVTGGRIPLGIGGFRAFRAPLAAGLHSSQGPELSIDAPLTGAAGRIEVIPVRHEPRRHGSSNYDLRMLARHALTELESLRSRPAGRPGSATYAVRQRVPG